MIPLLLLLLAPSERSVRDALSVRTGLVELPAGVIEISAAISLPEGAHDLEIRGAAAGTVLRASPGFRDRSILSAKSARNLRLSGFTVVGNRATHEKRGGLPPSDVPFARFTANNGLLIEDSEQVSIDGVTLREIAGFAVLASRSKGVRIERVRVEDSGSRNEKGRNNATGGILFEEGASDFRALDCTLANIIGNGIWTHSLYTSPRNGPGLIARNHFESIGRDAIQVGHATGVRVEDNAGTRIGYPIEAVDAEGGGTPVAIDTAGNVDGSLYMRNRFEEINGKCIDLDGFHDGEVRENTCLNRGRPEDYAFGHFAIVMNNSNPDMESRNIRVIGNQIDGTKFGGIFVIGTGHRIENNRMRNLNTAHCNEERAKFGCYHFPGEPDLLQSGIYLGRRAERPAPARGNIVRRNPISGYKMSARCIGFAPGVMVKENAVQENRCSDAAR